MSEYEEKFQDEINYLNDVINLLKYKLEIESNKLAEQKGDIIASRREMWENTTHTSADFDKLSDLNQYLSAIQNKTFNYAELAKRISRYEKMLDTPYFARIDFTEDGYDDTEKIYIGLFNLMDDDSHEIKVFDWRAPISSLYYRCETGPVQYLAPAGIIMGHVSLKRQYKIKHGKMEYFFDSNINIMDEMLKEALSKNMTYKMKTIVETIQKQQDLIIRDLDNDLLVVQGVAGSGKTSVALHRIAFLLYQGLNLNLSSNNIVVISPNNIFSKYISNVLPELGEENIEELTFENIFTKIFENKLSIRSKGEQYEKIISAKTETERDFFRSYIEFKGSSTFIEIIKRFISYYEHKIIKIDDIYFNGKYLENRQLIKSLLLSNKLNMPTSKKLKIIENRIMDKMHDERKSRREKIQKVVGKSSKHEFEIKSFTRVLAAKETSAFLNKLKKFTEFNTYELYKKLFSDKTIFHKISKGLKLPDNINEIIDYTKNNINDPFNIPYSDGIALIYMSIKAEGCNLYTGIKQVIVDEAQDYFHIHYSILKNIFKEARFTIVGDVNQAVEKDTDLCFYDNIIKIFNKQKYSKISLNKSYRSSYEINNFSKQLLNVNVDTEYFKRNEEKPEIISSKSIEKMDNKIIEKIKLYLSQDFESISIICKSKKDATNLYFRLKGKVDVRLIDYVGNDNISGITIIPIYLAKGLEFDAVVIYGIDSKRYNNKYDKKLLYIACTRALHRLSLYYTGKITPLIKNKQS